MSKSMSGGGGRRRWDCVVVVVLISSILVMASLFVSAEDGEKTEVSITRKEAPKSNFFRNLLKFFYQKGQEGYTQTRVWPKMKFGWKIVVGSIIGFFGAAFGSVGGVGGGGIFVPMLTLIIGFDAKSSTAISKCMIMGGAGATVYYNLRLRHPTLDMPLIDYDLALLFQPMLMLGISIGVTLNVVFAYWMITILLIILFIFMSTKAFFKGVETWKKETIKKKEAARRLESNGNGVPEVEHKIGAEETSNGNGGEVKEAKRKEVSILENVHWKEFGLLCLVWVLILGLQIGKNYTKTCSAAYGVLDVMQIPITVGVSAYEAVGLYKGRRVIASKGEQGTEWKVHKLVLYCCCGLLAGIVGGLLGLGGGFILGPLFLELGIPPQVSSATATFAMMFSSSMSVVEYYLLKRFPVPYALYFFGVATIAALAGQHVVSRIIDIIGRASLIVFILAFTIFVSAISLGGVGVEKMVEKIEKNQYMGFEDLCAYNPS